MSSFSRRIWLNPENHPSTGSLVAYHGKSPWVCEDKQEIITILELSDCHNKIRLHRADIDSIDDFNKKLIIIRDTINEFIEYLQNTKGDSNE